MNKNLSMKAEKEVPSHQKRLSNEKWHALITLHKILTQEHLGFFLASQHSFASRRLVAKHDKSYHKSYKLRQIHHHSTVPSIDKCKIDCIRDLESATGMSIKANDSVSLDIAPKGGLQMQRLKRYLFMFLNEFRY
jgi:hypothetical protein